LGIPKRESEIRRAGIIAQGLATEFELADMESKIESALDEAVAFAINSPFPDIAELKRDVFAYELA
jgi:pyruvate dehydrogenase E1 component alpha subunit